MVYVPGGKAWFKKRNGGNDVFLHRRGYNFTDLITAFTNDWHVVESDGRIFSLEESPSAHLQVLELLTRRIKTIELAREKWISEFTLPVLGALTDPKKMAQEYG